MDIVVGLLECEGFDGIWVVVERLSKMRHFVPCHTMIDAPGMAELVLAQVVHLCGLPLTIVSDRGSQFASKFLGQICCCHGIDHRMTAAFQPLTYSQAERVNGSMEQYLRVFVNQQHADRVQLSPMAEFAENMWHQSEGSAPLSLQSREQILGCHSQENQLRNSTIECSMLARSRQQCNQYMNISEWKWDEARGYRRLGQIEDKRQHQIYRKGPRFGYMLKIYKLQGQDGKWIGNVSDPLQLFAEYRHFPMSYIYPRHD